ncbi:helix-turn-helix domain-containing protein [Dactylosporangium sp. NPDC051484]|uniref:helix-turn-helix domain-containing protein n=1 Tax=Dactylosporangium sp. NPDC051484 TaxID=3154942 RepID=UPI00344C2D99
MREAVAGAIADPMRREILLMLRDEPRSAGQIADRFAITRPAVSRHLLVPREVGLVRDTAAGAAAPTRWSPHRSTSWPDGLSG